MGETGRDFWDGAVSMTPAAQKRHSVGEISVPFEASAYDITLFVYCYNNEDTLPEALHTLVEAMDVVGKSYEIVIIDDCSTDHSAEFAKGFMLEFPRVPLVLRINKAHKGLAENYVDAAFIGVGKYFRLVYGDHSEPVETMVDVLKAVGDADIVVPYYVSMRDKGRGVRIYEWLVNTIGGNSINHYGASQVHLRYNVMRWHSNTHGPAFQIDLLCRLLEQGFTVKQVPCRAVPKHPPMGKGYEFRRFWSGVHVLVDLIFRRCSK